MTVHMAHTAEPLRSQEPREEVELDLCGIFTDSPIPTTDQPYKINLTHCTSIITCAGSAHVCLLYILYHIKTRYIATYTVFYCNIIYHLMIIFITDVVFLVLLY